MSIELIDRDVLGRPFCMADVAIGDTVTFRGLSPNVTTGVVTGFYSVKNVGTVGVDVTTATGGMSASRVADLLTVAHTRGESADA